MAQKANSENLLIDFNNLSVNDESPCIDLTDQNADNLQIFDQNTASTKAPSEPMAFLCSSEPLYKLLNSGSVDADDNNPFDHLDKQACLSDDPFEIVENAALISCDAPAETELLKVETGTLISLESPVISKSEFGNEQQSKAVFDTPKKASETYESVQNTSPIPNSVSPKLLASPTGKSRGKTKSTSLKLLKYSLSNSRLDLVGENGPHSDGMSSADEMTQKKQNVGITARRESNKDDSFDDIWATKPNLIDSQTDIDIESDVDNDLAKLNIPMLNSPVNGKKSTEKSTSKEGEQMTDDAVETKAVNRSEILEKFASIKQKIPQSPMTIDALIGSIPNQTNDVKCVPMPANCNEDEPSTPKSQFSTVILPQDSPADNPNSLIENLKKLVDQCDDKSKQSTAKHLLDDLSSILKATNKASENQEKLENLVASRPPQLIKRQGTFSIEKESNDGNDGGKLSDSDYSRDSIKTDAEISAIDPGLSEVVKQIQNAFGSHQNVNVLQSMENSSVNAVNPTYIVVMTQPPTDFNDNGAVQQLQRVRSNSLTLKEKPLAAIRAAQQKTEQSRVLATQTSTPITRPTLQRRSSFGAIIRTTPKNENDVHVKPPTLPMKPEAPKVIRRRSIQAPVMADVKQPPKETAPMQMKPLNPIIRRRTFQGPSPPANTITGMRPPSPKPNLNSNLIRPNAPLRLQANTTGTLTRRKSMASDLTNSSKDTPQKLKTSYGIMKKPSVPPATRNLKIRVSQAVGGRSTAPLRAVVPINQVASMLLINDTVSSVDDNKGSSLITSTPRSIPSPAKSKTGT